eukprot:scaffold8450_cov215-Amphora_coffeaeformis.AAC.9
MATNDSDGTLLHPTVGQQVLQDWCQIFDCHSLTWRPALKRKCRHVVWKIPWRPKDDLRERTAFFLTMP